VAENLEESKSAASVAEAFETPILLDHTSSNISPTIEPISSRTTLDLCSPELFVRPDIVIRRAYVEVNRKYCVDMEGQLYERVLLYVLGRTWAK
jgi:hypothetical protein